MTAQSLFKTNKQKKYQIQILLYNISLLLRNLSECVCESESERMKVIGWIVCGFSLLMMFSPFLLFSDTEGRISPIEVHLF